MLILIGLGFFSYLLGSVPTGYLLARSRGIDIREVGSGNIGATNVARALGKKAAIATFTGDVLKGVIPVLIAGRLGLGLKVAAVAGLIAFLGHCFSVFLPVLIWLISEPSVLFYFALPVIIILIFNHRENIQRLWKGKESKF
ncbi:MAG: glycerol-3-phosphate acyltransferase [Proteobacteria bacterium]|nr:glycerol-3-phosphate acyltransferase [Pseudomonadota bacterium]